MRQALKTPVLKIGADEMSKDVRDELVKLRVSAREKHAIFAAAKQRGLTVSELIRLLVAKASKSPPIDGR